MFQQAIEWGFESTESWDFIVKGILFGIVVATVDGFTIHLIMDIFNLI